jgi:hypothetical protein
MAEKLVGASRRFSNFSIERVRRRGDSSTHGLTIIVAAFSLPSVARPPLRSIGPDVDRVSPGIDSESKFFDPSNIPFPKPLKGLMRENSRNRECTECIEARMKNCFRKFHRGSAMLEGVSVMDERLHFVARRVPVSLWQNGAGSSGFGAKPATKSSIRVKMTKHARDRRLDSQLSRRHRASL